MQNAVYPMQFLTLNESVVVYYSDDPTYSSIAVHSHNFVEFSYLAEGHGIEMINNVAHEMKPGYFSIINPWQTHELQLDAGVKTKYFYIAISLDNFSGAGSVALDLRDLFLKTGRDSQSYHYFTGEDYETMNAAFQSAYAEFKTRGKWWDLAVKSKIIDILILFDRKRGSREAEGDVHGAGNQAMEILFYIYNNFKEELSLSALSRHFGLTQNYLSTMIKSALGMNFLDFLQNLRMKYACSLLVSTAMPVTDIAYSSGYQSYRNFVRFFRKLYHISPSQFRALQGCSEPEDK
jgi:AraC-like DNA-binding protein